MRFRKYQDRLSASTANHSVPRQWLGRAANSTSKQDTQYIYFLLLEQDTRAGLAAMGERGKGQRGGAVPKGVLGLFPIPATGTPQRLTRRPGCQSVWDSVPSTEGFGGLRLAKQSARGSEQVLTRPSPVFC